MDKKLTPLVIGILTKPTREMIASLIEEAMSFPPGRFRAAMLNQARHMEKRLEKFNELDGRND